MNMARAPGLTLPRAGLDLGAWITQSKTWKRMTDKIFQMRGPELGEVFLNQRRVFILPTRAGLLLAAMLVALLLGSINYSLSLGFALTFLVAGIAWVGMFHTFRNLAHLHLKPGRVDPVFAGEIAHFRVVLGNRSPYDRFALILQADKSLAPVLGDPATRSEQTIVVPSRTDARGWQPMPRITFETSFPLGIWRAWAYWQPDLKVLAYPTPAPPDTVLPAAQFQGESGEGHAGPGSEDFAGIRAYVAGDPIKHLAWKAMARAPNSNPLTKIFDGAGHAELWLDLSLVPGHLGIEAALSFMTRWILDCDARDIRYGFRVPGTEIEPDHGDAHRTRCLEILALYGR
jgi:uncharacterized protein (DUF58 family)